MLLDSVAVRSALPAWVVQVRMKPGARSTVFPTGPFGNTLVLGVSDAEALEEGEEVVEEETEGETEGLKEREGETEGLGEEVREEERDSEGLLVVENEEETEMLCEMVGVAEAEVPRLPLTLMVGEKDGERDMEEDSVEEREVEREGEEDRELEKEEETEGEKEEERDVLLVRLGLKEMLSLRACVCTCKSFTLQVMCERRHRHIPDGGREGDGTADRCA